MEISATPRGELRQVSDLLGPYGRSQQWRSPLHPEGNCDSSYQSADPKVITSGGDLRYTPRGIATVLYLLEETES